MRPFFAAGVILLAPASLRASDYYIAGTALGLGTGTSALTAASASAFFNVSANWSPTAGAIGRISPGDTVHLVGNITTALTVQGSGTAGNPITILFEPGATMSAPAWAATGAIVLSGKNYITIDGGATGIIGGPNGIGSPNGTGAVNGVIQDTDNGTNLDNHISSVGIAAASCSNLIVKNLAISNLYVRTRGTEQNGYGTCVKFFWNGGATTYGNLTVTNCIFHDAYIGCSFAYKVSTNLTYSSCTAYNCNWGGNAADSEPGDTLTGLYVHDNRFYNWTNWDDTSGANSFHHNGFFGWAAQGGGSALTTVRYYNNYIGPNYSTAGDPTNHSSSGLFVQFGVADVLVYDNIFVANTNDNPSDGFIYLNPYASATSTYGVYNNTFVGGNAGIGLNFTPNGTGTGAQTVTFENNLSDGVATAVSIFENTTVTLASSYNLFYNVPAQTEFNSSATGSSSFKTLAQWQALGYDGNAVSGNPNLNANYAPQAPSAAVDAGTDLSALGSFIATDIAGTTRPQGTAWDIGAYELAQTAPMFATQPSAQSATFGGTANFSALVYGAPTIAYQWQVSVDGGATWTNLTDGALTDGAVISGSTTATLAISAVALDLNGDQYQVTATNSLNSATSTPVALTAAAAPQTITFNTLLPVTYGVSPITLNATVGSPNLASGLTLTYTSSNTAVATISGSTVTIVGGGTTTITASQAGNANYLAAPPVSQTLTVNPAGQTIAFNSLPAVTYGATPFVLTAAANSLLTPTYTSSNTAVATISGNTVTIVGGGTTTITASQAGNANYLAAPPVPQTLTVNPASQTITFNSLSPVTYGGPRVSLTANVSSGLTPTYTSSNTAVATISGSMITIVNAGTATITASQAGNASYAAALPVPQTLTVNPASQAISFFALPQMPYSTVPFSLTGTANSGLTPTYTSSNTAVATISGSTVTIVGVGSTMITANQAGNSNYLAAPSVSHVLTIVIAAQTITFAPLPPQMFGAPPFSPGAVVSSGLTPTYTSSNPSVATVSGGLVTLVSAGTTTITASQSGNANYSAASSVAQTLTVTPAQKPVITSATAASGIISNSFSYTITASNYPVSFNATSLPAGLALNTSTGIISGTPTGGGIFNVTISATNTAGSGSATLTLTLAAAPTITTQPASQTVIAGSPVTLSVLASGEGIAVTYQWQVSVNGGATWTNLTDGAGISGSATANLLISSAAGWLNGYEYQCIVTSSVGSTISAAAIVTVDAASAPATYFGAVGNGSGSASVTSLSHVAGSSGIGSNFAAEINTAATGGVLIGYISSINAGFAVSFTLNPTGGFSTTTSTLTGGTATSQTLTFNGQVASGTISGTIVELSLPFSAALDSSSGSSSAVSGFYQGAAIGTSGEAYSIVGTQGEVFALAVTSAGVGVGVGTASGSGTISVVTQNGVTVAGAVNASSGTLTGTITQSGGGVISFSGTTGIPSFTISPQPQTVATGRSVAFNSAASGSPAYLWTLNGAPIPGATDPILLVSNTTSASAGSYACVATNANGSATSTAATLTVTPTSNPGHLINLSTRANVGTGNNLLIGGFVIGGTGTKQLLVRGVGPTLTAPLGGSGELATPELTLVSSAVIASDIGWGNSLILGPSAPSDSPQLASGTLMDSLGAATYTAGSADTAMVLTAPVGNSTAEVYGVGGTTGIALVEFYDADTAPTPTAHLINISARADVGTGNNILIGGFAVSGATSETVLIRAVGPGLVDSDPNDFSLATVLNQPVLTLLNSSGIAIYSNTVWGGDATLANVFPTVGAFGLNTAHADSVLLVTLPAGTYTAEVSGLNGGIGIALCEIYEVQ